MTRFAGVDLCAQPAVAPPRGVVPNFVNPVTLVPVLIGVCTVMMTSAVLVLGGRLFVNRRKLTWSDHFAFITLVLAMTEGSLMLYQRRLARHQWDIPACWFQGNTMKIFFSRTILSGLGLFFSKVSLFLLFKQIFTVNRYMRIAIRVGLIASILLLLPNIPIQIYLITPHGEKVWADTALDEQGRGSLLCRGGIIWSLVSGTLNVMLDLYIFVLPMPIIAKLNWSGKQRLKAGAVFSAALLAITATVVSLVYRVKMWQDMMEMAWTSSIVLLCVLVELHMAVIVCSLPAFSKLVRVYCLGGRKSPAGSEGSGGSKDKNRPRTGRDGPQERYHEISESWLMRTNATAEPRVGENPGAQRESSFESGTESTEALDPEKALPSATG